MTQLEAKERLCHWASYETKMSLCGAEHFETVEDPRFHTEAECKAKGHSPCPECHSIVSYEEEGLDYLYSDDQTAVLDGCDSDQLLTGLRKACSTAMIGGRDARTRSMTANYRLVHVPPAEVTSLSLGKIEMTTMWLQLAFSVLFLATLRLPKRVTNTHYGTS